MVVIWNTSYKNVPFWARDIKSIIFLNCYHINFQGMQPFFGFLVSVINHYHTNELHLFCDSFEWFCLEISNDVK